MDQITTIAVESVAHSHDVTVVHNFSDNIIAFTEVIASYNSQIPNLDNSKPCCVTTGLLF